MALDLVRLGILGDLLAKRLERRHGIVHVAGIQFLAVAPVRVHGRQGLHGVVIGGAADVDDLVLAAERQDGRFCILKRAKLLD